MAACRPASTNGPSSSGRGWPPPPRQQMQDFKDKVVLVTGGATGIGRAAALAFGRRGAQVVMAGRRQSEGDKAVAALAEIGSRGSFIAADVTKTEDLAALHRTILEEYGRLDVAFNNAVYLSLQHQVRIMAQQGGGAIVVNTSVSGLRNPNPGLALYSASKAALVSLTRSAAMEYAEKSVRINAVAPGRVVTDMMLASKIMDMGAVAAGLPLRRMGRPEEVAEAVVWLASDAASFVVGHVLCTDGGFMAL